MAGDETLLFVTEPLIGRVVAVSRLTGHEIADHHLKELMVKGDERSFKVRFNEPNGP